MGFCTFSVGLFCLFVSFVFFSLVFAFLFISQHIWNLLWRETCRTVIQQLRIKFWLEKFCSGKKYNYSNSLKSNDVNFHTQMSSSHSEERTMLFTWRKKETIRPIRIANDVFFHVWEKWYVQSKATGVWVYAKIPTILGACSLQCPRFIICELLRRHSEEKTR